MWREEFVWQRTYSFRVECACFECVCGTDNPRVSSSQVLNYWGKLLGEGKVRLSAHTHTHTHSHTDTLTHRHRHSSQPIPCNNPGVERLPPLREERSCPFSWNYQTIDWQQKSTPLHKLSRWPVTSTPVQDLLCSVTNSNTTLAPSLPPAYPYYLSISRWAYQCLMSLQFTLNENARNKFLVISLYLI